MGEMGPVQYFICGGGGGVLTVLVGHPFDTIKVRLQTQPKPAAGQPPMYTGMMDCVKKTIAKEGVKGLYKGMGAPLASIVPAFAFSFLGFRIGKAIVGKEMGQFTAFDNFEAGALSGIFTASIMCPAERVKCLLQIQADAKNKKYDGPLDAVKKLYKEGGIPSIYRGFGATICRDIPAAGSYFMASEAVKDILTDHGAKEMTVGFSILAGGAAGIAFWIAGMPFDTLKSRLQTAPDGTYPNGIRDVYKELMQKEGAAALYTGLIPVMLRAFPANAACFVGFELCRALLMKWS